MNFRNPSGSEQRMTSTYGREADAKLAQIRKYLDCDHPPSDWSNADLAKEQGVVEVKIAAQFETKINAWDSLQRYATRDKDSLGIETRGMRDVIRICFSECDERLAVGHSKKAETRPLTGVFTAFCLKLPAPLRRYSWNG